jgi:hypothetical protein
MTNPILAMLPEEKQNPFLEMSAASILIVMGDSLDATPRGGERLFGSNDKRRERFKSRLEGSLAKRLAASGIKHRDFGDGGVDVIVYGHAIPGRSSGLDWVFYFDMSGYGPRPPDDPCWNGTDIGQGLLGASSDEQLEDVLINAIIKQLDEWLHERDNRSKR